MTFRRDNAAAQTAFRLAALENGYTPLPNHHKHCYVPGWDKLRPDAETIRSWQSKLVFQATGLRVCDGLCAIDIDIDDADMVQHVWNKAAGQFPQLRDALIRFGSGAKEMWVCRTDEPFSVIFSTGHVKPGEDPESKDVPMHRLEAFGGGHPRQIGAFGAHTMRPDGKGFAVEYRWLEDDSPAAVRLDDLPVLPKSAVLTIAAIVSDALAAADWPRVRNTRVGESAVAASYDLMPDMRFDCLDGVTRTLDQLSDYASTDRNARCSASWMGDAKFRNRTRCLVGVDHEGNVSILETANWTRHLPASLADRALPLSDKATALRDKLLEHGFDFDHDAYPDAPVSFQERVLELLENWAWCGSYANPCLPILRPEEFAMTLGNFRLTELRHSYEIEGPRGGTKRISPVDAWVGHSQRQDVDGYRFMPNRPQGIFTTDDGVRAINSYKAPQHPVVGDSAEHARYVALWEDFMRHLLPREEEREWFLDWLAFKKQNLTVPGVGVIMYAGEFGVGRGSLFEIIGAVFGDRYVNNVSADTLMGVTSQSQYTDWMANALFVTTDEVLPEGDEGTSMTWRRKKAYEKLKERIDPKPRRMAIVRKGQPNYQDWVYATFLLATNHDNAVPIPKGDRRLTVLTNSTVPLAQRGDILDRLNAERTPEMNPRFASSIARWLDERDVTGFNMQVAPTFTGKIAMQEANVTELENVVDGVIDNLPLDWATLDVVLDRVNVALIQQDLRDAYPQWRKIATDRLRELWISAGRAYVSADRQSKKMLFARSRDVIKRLGDMTVDERIAEHAEMQHLKTTASPKVRALRAGLREV